MTKIYLCYIHCNVISWIGYQERLYHNNIMLDSVLTKCGLRLLICFDLDRASFRLTPRRKQKVVC